MRLSKLLGILLATLSLSPVQAQDSFKPPVSEDHWAYAAVTNLMQKGILEGYPDGYFRGKRALTRDELAVAMDRLITKLPQLLAKERADKEKESRLQQLAPNLRQPVPQDHWAYGAMLELKQAGLFRRYALQGFKSRSGSTRFSFASLLRENRHDLMQPFVDNQRLLTPRVKELLAKLEQEFRVEIAALEAVESIDRP